jgi:hypothetical protein
LICDKQDRKRAELLRDHLLNFNECFEVELPLEDGNDSELADDHKDRLLGCDAAIIFYGRASEFWARQQLSDLRKSVGYGRSAPLTYGNAAFYIAPTDDDPKKAAKASFKTREAFVANNSGDISLEPLKKFVEGLLMSKGGGDGYSNLRKAI